MKFLFNWSEKVGNFIFWRVLTDFWSIVFYIAIVYDFMHHNALAKRHMILAIAAIYCACLAIYSAEKEFRRWHDMHKSIHPGELHVFIWTIFIVAFIFAQVVLSYDYHMPPEVGASYIAVITILALTRESKSAYKRRRKE